MTHILVIKLFVREMSQKIRFNKFKDLSRSFGILLGTQKNLMFWSSSTFYNDKIYRAVVRFYNSMKK